MPPSIGCSTSTRRGRRSAPGSWSGMPGPAPVQPTCRTAIGARSAGTAAIPGEGEGTEVLMMSSQSRWIVFGALMGLIGGIGTAGVTLAVGPVPGAATGLVAAAIAGASAARWAGRRTLRLAVESLASLTGGDTDGEDASSIPPDPRRFAEEVNL